MTPYHKPADPQRIIIDFSQLGFSDVLRLGRYEYVHARNRLSTHFHPDSIEICYLAKGKQVYEVNGEYFTLSGGDVFLTFPNETHSSGPFPEEKGILYWLILHISQNQNRFINQTGVQAEQLKKALLAIQPRQFRGSPILKHYLDSIIASWQDGSSPFRSITIENYLMAFLLEILRSNQSCCFSEYSASIVKAIRFIASNLNQPLQVPDIAKITHLSVSRFKAKFKEELGIPPADYIARQKVEKAKDLLRRQKMSITKIAFSLGFSSSQYFATVFKKYTNQTPRQFRQNHQQSLFPYPG